MGQQPLLESLIGSVVDTDLVQLGGVGEFKQASNVVGDVGIELVVWILMTIGDCVFPRGTLARLSSSTIRSERVFKVRQLPMLGRLGAAVRGVALLRMRLRLAGGCALALATMSIGRSRRRLFGDLDVARTVLDSCSGTARGDALAGLVGLD